jgi:hypothetical protein
MNADTTTTPATSTPLPQRRQRTEPERARAFGDAIQNASRRTSDNSLATAAAIAEDKAVRANRRAGREYVRGLNRAKGLLQRAAAIKPDDTVGEFADHLAHQIEQAVERAESTVVPDPTPALPTGTEVPS